jgi:hypothetical protein
VLGVSHQVGHPAELATREGPYGEFLSLLPHWVEAFAGEGEEAFVVLPLRFSGGRWSTAERAKFSTFRERCCLLHAVEEFKPFLARPVLVCSHDENVGKIWREKEKLVDTTVGMREFVTFQGNVDQVCHVERTTAAIVLVDALARRLKPAADEGGPAPDSEIHGLRERYGADGGDDGVRRVADPGRRRKPSRSSHTRPPRRVDAFLLEALPRRAAVDRLGIVRHAPRRTAMRCIRRVKLLVMYPPQVGRRAPHSPSARRGAPVCLRVKSRKMGAWMEWPKIRTSR